MRTAQARTSGRRRSIAAALLVAAATSFATTGSPAYATADPGQVALTAMNQARASAHLVGYRLASDLAAVAARHARQLAREDRLYHNPRLATEVHGWQAVGENVGYGADAAQIHQAFMDSPDHRANILDHDFTQVGVGAARNASGALYVVEVFRQPEQHLPASAPRRAPAPAPATRTPRRPPLTTPVVPVTPRPRAGEPHHHLTWADLIHALRNLLDRLDEVSS